MLPTQTKIHGSVQVHGVETHGKHARRWEWCKLGFAKRWDPHEIKG